MTERKAGTGHVIGATYRSGYWGHTFKVIDSVGECGVLVEMIEPGTRYTNIGTPGRQVGERWSHSTPADLHPKDIRLS